MKIGACFLTFLLCFSPVLAAPTVSGGPSNETMMKNLIVTSTYGVISGTLVGLATLAFLKKPEDNLRNIAKGASLGLYIGLSLGLYVTYAHEINKLGTSSSPKENSDKSDKDKSPDLDLFSAINAADPIKARQAQGALLAAVKITPNFFRIGVPNFNIDLLQKNWESPLLYWEF